MTVPELLDRLVALPTLLVAIIVYGFAPGFLLRLIVLAYERDDPRRAELIAELYDVPRLKRPFWVAPCHRPKTGHAVARGLTGQAEPGEVALQGALIRDQPSWVRRTPWVPARCVAGSPGTAPSASRRLAPATSAPPIIAILR